MAVELKVPEVGESITEVQVGDWLKSEGERVRRDEVVVMIETDKVTVELPAPVDGVVTKILVKKGQVASVGDVIGTLEPAAGMEVEAAPDTAQVTRVMPSARRELAERGLALSDVTATGPGGRLLKEDVLRQAERSKPAEVARAVPQSIGPPSNRRAPIIEREPATPPPERPATPPPAVQVRAPAAPSFTGDRQEEVVAMTPMRRRIAERLVESQQTAALLTTFNEFDMSAVIALRKEHQERFQQAHGTKLGFMSFFVKAAVEALKLVPAVNAEVRGTDIVYRNYYDIGVAVGGGRGLVVPVLRNAERLGFAEVEKAIGDFGERARTNKLKLDELQGGTFTISNGGVYGSLLSTPIVNPPQSGILGLHAIQERAVVRDGQVVARSMMYVALTYDHRLIDGREAVTFLKRIKECVEAPARILLEV